MKMSTPQLNDTAVSTMDKSARLKTDDIGPTCGFSWAHYHEPLQQVGSGPLYNQDSNHFGVGQTTIFAIDGLDHLPWTYGSVWPNPIVASDLKHANIPQLAGYGSLGFAGDEYDSTGTSQSLDFSLPEVAAVDYGHRYNFQLDDYGSTGQKNVDVAWPYTSVDQQSDVSANFQLPYQPLPPTWSIEPMSQPPNASAAPLLHYQTFFTPSSFGHANLPPNDTFTVQQPYQQALLPLPPSPEALQHSAPAAIILPRQHPASLTARKTTKVTNKNRFLCPKGCTRTFGREDDLRRHMKKHEAPEFKCFDIDCIKTFYRLDKLRDHAKQVHGFNL